MPIKYILEKTGEDEQKIVNSPVIHSIDGRAYM